MSDEIKSNVKFTLNNFMHLFYIEILQVFVHGFDLESFFNIVPRYLMPIGKFLPF